MRKLIAILALLVAWPVSAQYYAHRSNPGDPSTVGSGIGATGFASGVCAETGGGDTLFISITGTWVATLSFVGTNDNGATTKALMVYPFNASGGLGGAVASTTANGDWQGPTSGFRKICVVATAFTSNASMAVRVDADPGVDFVLMEGLGFNGASTPPRYCDKTAAFTTLGATAVIQQIAGVALQNIWVCGYQLSASTATAGTTLQWVEGTGSNCVTGQANVGGVLVNATPTAAPGTPNLVFGPSNPALQYTATAGDSLCLKQGQAVNSTAVNGILFYTQN